MRRSGCSVRSAPDPETEALCERVHFGGELALLIEAREGTLAALGGADGVHLDRRARPLAAKARAVSVPPFRALLMNEHGDFFAGTPGGVLRHMRAPSRDAALSAWNRVKDIHRGAWLWAFALVAQYSAPSLAGPFEGMWGGQPRSAAGPQACCDNPRIRGHLRYQSRHWNWDELMHFAHSTKRGYFCLDLSKRADGVQPILLPLFSDPRTFAVSRQADYRDWKPSLFATAAFRRLQPGEAAQTLAPVSGLLLVDREKLLTLGIPKTVVPGAAWCLIFWKAAAAGWRSYSVGGTGRDRRLRRTGRTRKRNS